MNKKDEKGLKQGYWEDDYRLYTWKGTYIDGEEHGIWKCYVAYMLYEISLYENGELIYTKVNDWRGASFSYIENRGGRHEFIHNEEENF